MAVAHDVYKSIQEIYNSEPVANSKLLTENTRLRKRCLSLLVSQWKKIAAVRHHTQCFTGLGYKRLPMLLQKLCCLGIHLTISNETFKNWFGKMYLR